MADEDIYLIPLKGLKVGVRELSTVEIAQAATHKILLLIVRHPDHHPLGVL